MLDRDMSFREARLVQRHREAGSIDITLNQIYMLLGKWLQAGKVYDLQTASCGPTVFSP